MLAEILLHAVTRTEPWIDRIGYRKGAVRLWSRYGRCKRVWAPHLEKTRAVVREAAAACAGSRTALVFGSGLLADLPLDLLAAKFRRVELVDIVHLPLVRWRTRNLANVRHVVHDLTGVGAALVVGDLAEPRSRYGLDDPAVDFVVSLNLVSQLPLGPCEWLETQRGWSEERAAQYGRRIVAAHLAHLAGFRAPVCLVGDAQRMFLDKTGRTIETQDALYGVGLPRPDAEWPWDLAPIGEISPDYAVRNRVIAIRELRDSTRLG
jgi:hypothetical protein